MVEAASGEKNTAPWIKFVKAEDRGELTDSQKLMYEAYDKSVQQLDKISEMPLIEEDKEKRFEARQDGFIAISRCFIPDFSLDKFREFRTNIKEHVPIL